MKQPAHNLATNDYPTIQGFLDRAWEFYQAYLALSVRPPPSWPRYFMLCHSIELPLKAYLFSRGCSMSELRTKNLGHDLRKLLSRALSERLPLEASAQRDIEALHEAHTEFWARYPKQHAKPVFVIEQFEPCARELLEAVTKSI